MAIHKVKKGETFSQIAERLGIQESELRRLNKGVQTLSTGQGIKVPSLSASTRAGGLSYQTGPNERKVVTGPNGEQIRLGPNSSYTPTNAPTSAFQQFMNRYFPSQAGPSGESSVRGALPGTGKGFNGLASPVAYQGGLGVNASMGAYNPSFVPGPQYGALTRTSLANTAQAGGMIPRLGVNSQIGQVNPALGNSGQIGSYNAPFGPNYGALSYRNPTFFSYAPQGQPNSYTPYKPAQPAPLQAAPFMTTSMLANPTYGQPAQIGQYGNYAAGNKLYSGQPLTAQEAFQQGKNNVSKRWWIGRGGNKSYGAQVQPLAPPEQIQTINWRV